MRIAPALLLVCCVFPVAAAGQGPSEPMHRLRVGLQLAEHGADAAEEVVVIRLAPLCSEGLPGSSMDGGQCADDPRSVLEARVAVPGETVLSLPRGEWSLAGLSEEFWIPLRSLELSGAQSGLDLPVFPAGFAEAGFRTVDQSELPGQVVVEFEGLGGQEVGPERQTCAVDDGRLDCRLPALMLDLRLEAEGFVPIYLWDVEISAAARKRLGTLELRRGSSVVGWVEPPERGFSFEQVEVELAPLGARSASATERRKMASLRHQARVNNHGFFQIPGVRAGRYVVAVDHPRFAQTRLEVTVGRGEEIELAPLALSPAANLNLEIEHATDPFLKPWTVKLARRGLESGHFEQVVETQSDLEGRYEHPGLDPGDYQLTLFDSRGSRWHTEVLQLFAGENAIRSVVEFRRLVGTVLLDDEPLAGAEIELQEHRGSASFHYRSREEGKFYAFLRAGTLWDIKIIHEPTGVLASFPEFAVPRTKRGENYAEKTFEIPDTELFGEVVEIDGSPVEDPLVLTLSGGVVFQKVLSGNSFAYRGLTPGAAYLEAKIDGSVNERRAGSRQMRVELAEGFEQGPIRLVLEDRRSLEGLVVGPDGQGIPGARVIALVESADGALLSRSIPETTSDQDGVFDLAIPAAAEAVQVTAFPLGFAIAQQRVDLRGSRDQPVILPVDALTGTLTVHYDLPEAWRQDAASLTRAMTQLVAEYVIPGLTAVPWTRSHGQTSPDAGEWVIPGMPTGRVSVCFGLPLQLWLGSGGRPDAALLEQACVDGELAPGENLVLAVPEDLVVAAMPERSPAG